VRGHPERAYNRILRVSPRRSADPGRDRYIQSKGHSVEALFVVLADRGFVRDASWNALPVRSHFVGHPTRKVPGIEQNTGALGHGLSFGVGVAIAGRMISAIIASSSLLGDGELAEGSNWEAAWPAAHYELDNLIAIVDHNTLQITGPHARCVLQRAAGRKVPRLRVGRAHVDGHSIPQLTDVLSQQRGGGTPLAVIANTIKGKGVSFMEDVAKWHHGVPSEAEYRQAIAEIDAGIARARREAHQ
jgi:transketolase